MLSIILKVVVFFQVRIWNKVGIFVFPLLLINHTDLFRKTSTREKRVRSDLKSKPFA